jgi:hypothetical protein
MSNIPLIIVVPANAGTQPSALVAKVFARVP